MPSIEQTEDELLLELEREDDDLMESLREKRIQEIKIEMETLEKMRQKRFGEYSEIFAEKEILHLTTSEKRVVVHFYHKDFRRCQILDNHLKGLAEKYAFTKFVKINVDNAPFLVTRLQVQVLPCVICFLNGIAVDRLVGFEELGNVDNFKTPSLEKRLSKNDILRNSFN